MAFARSYRRWCMVLAALLLPLAAGAADNVRVTNAWVRAPAPGQTVVGGYMELTSERDAAVVAVGSPAAGRAEMHSSAVEGGVMKMRALPRIELPAGRTVKLAPGGTHLMLMALKRPVKPGDKLPIVLSVQPAGAAAGMSLTTVTVEAEVRTAAPSGHQHH